MGRPGETIVAAIIAVPSCYSWPGEWHTHHHTCPPQAFAILALARYARAANDSAAADWAWRVFESVDAARHDAERGGYLEGGELRYPRGVGVGTSPGAERSQNTHLHLLEALTELSAALGAAGGRAELQVRCPRTGA